MKVDSISKNLNTANKTKTKHNKGIDVFAGSIERSLLESPKGFGRNLNSSLFFLNQETEDQGNSFD